MVKVRQAPPHCLHKAVFLVLGCLGFSQATTPAQTGTNVYDGPILKFGSEVTTAITDIANSLLGEYDKDRGGGSSLVVGVGKTDLSRLYISKQELDALKSPDAFLVKSRTQKNGTRVFVCAGKTLRSTGYALLELLQTWGFAFLHPLKPVSPESLLLQPADEDLDIHQAPRWEFRGTHYHTQHPLELTNLLNGYDVHGDFQSRSAWKEAFPEWEAFLTWMLAQKQNYVEWMLLADPKAASVRGGEFELSDERRARLRMLVDSAHNLGLEVGIDVPLTLQQQHALNLLPAPTGRWDEDFPEIKSRVEWMLSCGFDHLGTELGTTEFTRGLSAEYMVRVLNETQKLIGSKRRIFVKNHCSTGQTADGYFDPRPDRIGEPLNFNYLSYQADPRVVNMPHTVQIYSLEDRAPTYGNADFSDLRNWTRFLLESGRPVVLYPETAYWVNYDINVPLFLAPIYSHTRLADARILDKLSSHAPMGQLNFESGWQWGYWVANSAQALVAWQDFSSTDALFAQIFRFIGQVPRMELVSLLKDFTLEQKRLLIDGVDAPPAPGTGLGSVTGMAYLQGSEGVSDFANALTRVFSGHGAPAPDKLQFRDLWNWPSVFRLAQHGDLPEKRRQWYAEHLRPLLVEMNFTFARLSRRFQDLPSVAATAEESVKDLRVTAKILSLRCRQVLALYEHAATCDSSSDARCNGFLAESRQAMEDASALIPEREERYGLVAASNDRVFSWRAPNPTAYAFGYLWSAHHLFYWQRDQAIVEQRVFNPCFANIQDPIELGLPGGGKRITHFFRDSLKRILYSHFWPPSWRVGLTQCMFIPQGEPNPAAAVRSGLLGVLRIVALLSLAPILYCLHTWPRARTYFARWWSQNCACSQQERAKGS